MRLSLEKKKKKEEEEEELKLQAAMEGTSPGSPPTGGFRKTGKVSNMHLKR